MRRLLFLLGVAAAVALLLFGIDRYRHRFVRHNTDLVHLLPPGNLTIVYADISLLRRADLLGILANIKVAPDKQYNDFIQTTGFDYTRDLDAVILAADAGQTYLLGRGRFNWDKLKTFAFAHQGTCANDACRVPATTPGRWVNFITVQSDVLAVAISGNQSAADNLRPPGRRLQEEIPDAPVWAKLSPALLNRPELLPLPLRMFAISLQSADAVTVSAQPSSLQVKATFANPTAADSARYQLGRLQTSGSFLISGNTLVGTWPIQPEMLKSLQH